MRISRSSKILASLLLPAGALAVAAALADAPTPPCSAFEAEKTIAGNTSTFRDSRFPWVVTTDLDGKIVIENTAKKTHCSTNLDSVISVYMGRKDPIYFRSTEIASDELFTVNGVTCKDAAKMKPLDLKSEAKTKSILRAMGICARR